MSREDYERSDLWPPPPEPPPAAALGEEERWRAGRTEVWPPPGYGFDLDRLTHLVLVDGRLVETWSEPVEGTRWARHAERFDAERRPAPAPVPPPYERALRWLAGLCGGRAGVAALDAEPLVDIPLDLTRIGDDQARARIEEADALLVVLVERWFEPETGRALRRGLLRLGTDEPAVVGRFRSAGQLAAGTCWAVGRANGLFRPVGALSATRIGDTVAFSGSLTDHGQRVRAALRGFRVGLDHAEPPSGESDLLALGHLDLLTTPTRQRLVRVRDRAIEAHAEALESVLPPTVERAVE